MKKTLFTLFLISSTAFASKNFDYNFSKISQGGNADIADFSFFETMKTQKKYLGKSALVPIELCIDVPANMVIGGYTSSGKIEQMKGVLCTIKGTTTQIGVAAELKQREELKSNKVKSIEGDIVALNEVQRIVINAEKLNY